MTTLEIGKEIIDELSRSVGTLDNAQLDSLEKRITDAGKIYVAGAGRSLLMIRGLAMRLMHMGYKAFVVGETVTPAAEAGDLLIIGSGSGETGSLISMAEKSKKLGVSVALITINPDSSIGKLADCVVRIDAATTKGPMAGCKSMQLGGSLFEQSLLILCDALIIHMIKNRDLADANAELMRKHANLE